MVALDLVFEVAAVVLIAVVGYWIWDRRRYRGSARGAAGLVRTGEVFVDPATGRCVRVWLHPRSGRREYREEDGA